MMKATMNRNASKTNRISADNVKIAKQIAKIFATVIDQEKKVETRREVLCEMTDFEPYSKYLSILKYDKANASGIVNAQCFKRFLEYNNLSQGSRDYLLLEQDRELLFEMQFKTKNPN